MTPVATPTRIPAEVLDRVRAAHDLVEVIGREVELTRRGASFKGPCPFHEDGTPSFDVNPEKQTFKCFGCEAQGDVIAWTMKRRALPFRDAVRALAEEKGIDADLGAPPTNGKARPGPAPVGQTWVIRDADGNVVAEHVRLDHGAGKKSFVWRRNGESGLGGLACADVPLYGSEHLRALPDEAVVVTEGEKAADSLAPRGILAVGTVTGASSCPSARVLEVLRGRDVVLWPDADEPGRRHMARLGALLATIAASVRVAVDPGAEDGDDAADLAAFEDDVVRGILADAVPFPGPLAAPTAPSPASVPQASPAVPTAGAEPAPEAPLPFRTLRQVTADAANKPRPPALWPSFLAVGQVATIAGAPKSGKTEIAFAWAAALSRGSEWLGTHPDAVDVIIVTEEDDADLVDKLGRYGADLDRVHVLNPDGGAGIPTFGKLVSDIEGLAASTAARACVIDTFAAWGGLTGDDERNEGVVGPLVRMLRPLKAVGLATLLVHHTVKDGEADGVAAVRGSGALAAEVNGFAVLREAGRGAPENRRILKAWTRSYGKSTSLLECVVPTDGGDPHYRLVTEDVARDAKAAAYRACDRKVVEALRKVGGWLPKKAIVEASGLSARTLDAVLAGLVATEHAMRSGTGTRADPFVYAVPGTPRQGPTDPGPGGLEAPAQKCAEGAQLRTSAGGAAEARSSAQSAQPPLGGAHLAQIQGPRTTTESRAGNDDCAVAQIGGGA